MESYRAVPPVTTVFSSASVISSMSLVERAITFLLYPVVGLLADISLDAALYVLAALCAIFAVAARVNASHLPQPAHLTATAPADCAN